MAAGTSFTSFRNEPINVTFEGRSLQLRPDQLTVDVLSKVFHLIPETILLVSDVGTIATADEGIFAGVNGLYIWTVEGTKATNISGSVLGRSVIGGAFGGPKLKVKPNIAERRKVPYRVPPSSSFRMRNLPSGSWNKSIEICYLRNEDVVQKSEHPITLDEASANVTSIQEIISNEAFNGAPIRLLNAKNFLIADAAGTRGSKFWHTSKKIRAISKVDYEKLEKARNCGPGSSINLVSESSSEELFSIFESAKNRKNKGKCYVPPPPDASDTDVSTTETPPPAAKFSATVDVRNVLLEIKENLKAVNPITKKICEIFTCIICKELSIEIKNPVMPSCCQSMICCKACIIEWLTSSESCPHCRQPLTINNCITQPPIKPLFELLQNN